MRFSQERSSGCRRSRRCSPPPSRRPGRLCGGQVRAEVVADDRDPDVGRVERAQVAAELQEPGPGLARLDVAVELVLAQVVGGEQVPHPVPCGCRWRASAAAVRGRVVALAADRGPLPARVGLQVQRPELVHAEDHLRLAVLGYDLAVGDRVQVLDPGLLRRVVGVAGGFPGLQALKGDALLAEQDPQALVADVVDHPLGDQEVRQLGQAPGRERQVMLGRPGLGDLLDLPALGQRELRRRPPLYLGYSESKPSALKLWITSRTRSSLVNVTFAIAATCMPCADSSTICARRQVTTDPVPRRMIRSSRRPSSSSISRTRRRSVTGPVSVISTRRKSAWPGKLRPGKRDLLRH